MSCTSVDIYEDQPISRAVIAVSGSGNNTIVAAITGKRIRVLAFVLTMTGTAVTARFEDGAGGTALTGPMTQTQGSTIVAPFNPLGWFETLQGDAPESGAG